jgi:uncharacterized membrane protein
MAGGFVEFGAALVAFIGSHAVAGLPGIRGRLMAGLGARTYRIAYSVVSLALLTWVISAAIRAPYVGLWGPFPWTTALLVTVMAPASVLLAASVLEPNPFSLSFARGRFDPARPGTAGLIRHPLPLAFALWAGAHLIANGDAVQAVLFGSLLALSLAGPGIGAAKARRGHGVARLAAWREEMALAPLRHRIPRPITWMAGLGLYGALLLLHGPVIGPDPLAML